MKITPLEIRQKTFEKGFRGYEKEEVDAYLLTLSMEWEKVLEDIREQKTKLDTQDKELQKMREVESSLYKTLKTAETTGSNMVEQANRTAELMLKEAQMNSDAVLNEARYNAKTIIEEAESKARNFEEEAKDRIREAQREIKEIENLKENLLIEIKSVANETLERLNKYATKPKKPVRTETPLNSPLFSNTQDTEVPDAFLKDQPVGATNEQKPASGSFFDNI